MHGKFILNIHISKTIVSLIFPSFEEGNSSLFTREGREHLLRQSPEAVPIHWQLKTQLVRYWLQSVAATAGLYHQLVPIFVVRRQRLYFSVILVDALGAISFSPSVYKLSVKEEEKFVLLIKSITSQEKGYVQIEDLQMVTKEVVYDM